MEGCRVWAVFLARVGLWVWSLGLRRHHPIFQHRMNGVLSKPATVEVFREFILNSDQNIL